MPNISQHEISNLRSSRTKQNDEIFIYWQYFIWKDCQIKFIKLKRKTNEKQLEGHTNRLVSSFIARIVLTFFFLFLFKYTEPLLSIPWNRTLWAFVLLFLRWRYFEKIIEKIWNEHATFLPIHKKSNKTYDAMYNKIKRRLFFCYLTKSHGNLIYFQNYKMQKYLQKYRINIENGSSWLAACV